MKKFIGKAVLFCGLFVLLLFAVCALATVPACKPFLAEVTNTTDYIENTAVKEILPAIDSVSKKDAKTKLIIGDSVCFRLFDWYREENPEYCIAPTNRGVGMSGQYILAEVFLENHPEATDVYLVITTNTLITGYETIHGYQYAVQPFLERGHLHRLDEETLDEMRSTYGAFVTNDKMLHFVDNSPVLKKAYFNVLNEYFAKNVKMEIPHVVENYIVKMHDLCEEKGVTMHLLPSPIPDSQERKDLEVQLEKLYEETEIYPLFPSYYENLTYYPAEYFSDGIHPDLDSEGTCGLIHDIQEKNSTLLDFNLPY